MVGTISSATPKLNTFYILRCMEWDEFDEQMRELQAKIDFTPDLIVGIARGGVIPATLLAKRLNVKDMFLLKLEKKGESAVSAYLTVDISGKNVLLVEDMLETGRSLIGGKRFLEARGAMVRTACLYTMPKSEIRPDYFLRQVSEVAQFPWNN